MNKIASTGREGDHLRLVKIGWRFGLGLLIGLVIVIFGLFINLQSARADTIQNNNTNTNKNEQKQEQKQDNEQKVEVEVKQTVTSTVSNVSEPKEATGEATTSAKISKTPETGAPVMSLVLMAGAIPLGLFLARFGKIKLATLPLDKTAGFGSLLVRSRSRRNG